MTKELEIRLHSAIADAAPACIKLWYYCRALSNNGRAIFSIQDAVEALDISRRTLRDWLQRGRHYFREIVREGGIYICYYKSLYEVAEYLELDNWGAVAPILVEDLNNIKVHATRISALALQAASRKLRVIENRREEKDTKTWKPEDFFNPSKLSSGVLLKDFFLVNHRFSTFGASHRGVANKLNRSEATITRRLNKTNLTADDEWKKIRLAQTSWANTAEYHLLAEEWSPEVRRFIKYKGRFYKLLTNVYYPFYSLTSMKKSKTVFNKKLEEKKIGKEELAGNEVLRREG